MLTSFKYPLYSQYFMFLCLLLTWVLKPETQETFLQAHWLTNFVHTQMN